MDSLPCEFCGHDIALHRERCPHCARPGLFPNVRTAQVASERAALDERYQAALRHAESLGARRTIEAFESAAHQTKAVMARPLRELDRLACSDKDLFSTYYNLVEGEVRLPDDDKWGRLRILADVSLFPGYHKDIRFAALSLDDAGLSHYGECSFVFRESFIAHRASVYEENSALFLQKHAYAPPPGHRATWEERSKLSVAKLGKDIEAGTTHERFTFLLLWPGPSEEEDRFIEVHIWGPMSIRTVERVLLAGSRKRGTSHEMAIRERLSAVGVPLEEVQ